MLMRRAELTREDGQTTDREENNNLISLTGTSTNSHEGREEASESVVWPEVCCYVKVTV